MIRKQTDFIATLTYLSTEEGGRKTLTKSGYGPQIKFPFSELQTSGQQTFINSEVVLPGETLDAEIQMLSPQFFFNSLTEGMDFDIREGAKILGTGKIKLIVNNVLRKVSGVE